MNPCAYSEICRLNKEQLERQIVVARKYLLFIAEHACTRENGCLACEAGLGLLEMDQIQSGLEAGKL